MAFSTVNTTSDLAVDNAFDDKPDLRRRIYSAIASTPQHASIFHDIAEYASALKARAAASQPSAAAAAPSSNASHDGPAPKKRKIVANGGAGSGVEGGSASALSNNLKADADLQFYVRDTSFAIPQRKKLQLELTRDAATTAGSEYLRARNQASNEVEFGVPTEKIRHALCLPVPEKSQRQLNFCIIPQYTDGITPAPEGEAVFEPMVFTVPDGPPRTAFHGSGTPVMDGASLAETYQSFVQSALNDKMKGTKVVCPDTKQFVSAMPEAHRKGEKAYHVKAFRGSKEGYLFFLSTGVFFGFKKPLMFFAFENIESVSYTSVLQRTFNLNIAARPLNGSEVHEFEFSMIDQADYAGIDAYVKKHSLQDASMAEARRAKKLNINPPKDGDGQGDGTTAAAAGTTCDGEEEESELRRAERELEDQEDAEEEDYDPGSDADSDGSGTSSEEEEEYCQEGGDGGQAEGTDLVKEELGSEAEDVDVD